VHLARVYALPVKLCLLARVFIQKLYVYLVCVQVHDLRTEDAVVVSYVRNRDSVGFSMQRLSLTQDLITVILHGLLHVGSLAALRGLPTRTLR